MVNSGRQWGTRACLLWRNVGKHWLAGLAFGVLDPRTGARASHGEE